MPKGYLIANVRVDNPQAYETYVKNNGPLFERHGAKVLIRGGAQEVFEGEAHPRTVVLEFESLAAARAFYDDPDYVENRKIRQANAVTNGILVEGA